MKKKIAKTAACVLALSAAMGIGAFAGANNKEIAALLCYDVKLKYNMEEQMLVDANGKRIYPINYEGSTYLPVRAISNMLGVNVAWDDTTRSVLLGRTGEVYDFLETFKPVRVGYISRYYQKGDNQPLTLGNKTYNSYVKWNHNYYKPDEYCISYDLEGKYDTLTFHAYCDYNTSFDIIGDDEQLLYTVDIVGGSIPKEIKVDIHGTSQFKLRPKIDKSLKQGVDIYIVDATIE